MDLPPHVAASTDADPIDDDCARRGQYREIFPGIVLIRHSRCRLTRLVVGLAKETVPGGGCGLERGDWFESVFGQQGNLMGHGPGGVCPGQDGHAEASCEREELRKQQPVLGNAPPGTLRGVIGKAEHGAQ